jgi:superkiller protein 3
MRNFILSLFFLILPITHLYSQDLLKEQAKEYRQEGYRLQLMGDLEGALVYYQKAIEIDPFYVEAINDIGVVYEGLGDQEAALTMYKKALEIDPSYLPAYTNLAFLYEKKGDIKKATYYWQKRYELGKRGEYWWEVARQHLLKLGTYPQIRKEILEKAAAQLSKELVYKREQQRLKTLEEAKLHLNIGESLFIKGKYNEALKEFNTALSLNPPSEELKIKIEQWFEKTKKIVFKEESLAYIEQAIEYIKKDDFLSAGEKLKNALSSIFRIAQEKNNVK